MAVRLIVVRFMGVGSREYHEMACWTELPDNMSRLVYKDREIICATRLLCKVEIVSGQLMMTKAHVFSTVLRDLDALAFLCPEYSEVRSCVC